MGLGFGTRFSNNEVQQKQQPVQLAKSIFKSKLLYFE